jgi:type II secretory pathway pseudopilin PulG
MRPGKRRRRSGAVLLEVLVALVILTTAGAVIVVLGADTARAVERARVAEADQRRAAGFFELVTLWPRTDLDRHLGEHEQGPWRLRVGRPTSTLYTLTLTDSLGVRTLLHTVVYRPEPSSEAP